MAELSQITEGTLDGSGSFDKLMRTVDEHIRLQFASNGLDSATYAEIYVQSLQVVLQTSLDFALKNERQAEEIKLIQAQAALTNEQALTELSQRDKILAEISLTEKQEAAVDASIAYDTARTALANLEATRYTAETPKYLERLDLEIEATTKQNLIADEQLLSAKEAVLIAKQEVIKATNENAQILEQTKLIQEQTKVATEQIAKTQKEVELLNAEVAKSTKENARIDAEKALLEQKKVTESAATTDIATGTIGKQQELYKQQAIGFQQDALVKKTKALGDIYAVTKSNDPDATTAPSYEAKLNNLITQY